jgi:hypothetical protein
MRQVLGTIGERLEPNRCSRIDTRAGETGTRADGIDSGTAEPVLANALLSAREDRLSISGADREVKLMARAR